MKIVVPFLFMHIIIYPYFHDNKKPLILAK
jgi:hypothetical protein